MEEIQAQLNEFDRRLHLAEHSTRLSSSPSGSTHTSPAVIRSPLFSPSLQMASPVIASTSLSTGPAASPYQLAERQRELQEYAKKLQHLSESIEAKIQTLQIVDRGRAATAELLIHRDTELREKSEEVRQLREALDACQKRIMALERSAGIFPSIQSSLTFDPSLKYVGANDSEISRLHSIIETASASEVAYRSELKALNRDLQASRLTRMEAEERSQALEEQLKSKEDSLQQTRNELSKSLEVSNSLMREIDSLRRDCERLEEQLAAKTQEMISAAQKAEKFRQSLESQLREREMLLKHTQERLDNSLITSKSLSNELDALRDELTTYKNENQQLTASQRLAQDQLDHSLITCTGLTREIETLRHELSNFNRDNSDLKFDLQTLRTKSQSDAEKARLNEEQLLRTHDNQRAQIGFLQKQIETLETKALENEDNLDRAMTALKSKLGISTSPTSANLGFSVPEVASEPPRARTSPNSRTSPLPPPPPTFHQTFPNYVLGSPVRDVLLPC